MKLFRFLRTAAFIALGLAISRGVAAQDAPKADDDPIKKLLGELDSRPVAPKDKDKSDDKPADKPKHPAQKAEDTPQKPGDKPEPKPADSPKPAAKPDVDPKSKASKPLKDDDLDDFLEKLSKTPDAPSPDGRPPMGGGGEAKPESDAKPVGGKGNSTVSDVDKKLDDRLDEILGRKKKKPKSDDEGDGQDDGGGMLGEAVKKMREVEQRLERTDTGEATRKTQDEIVKNLDQVMDEVRKQAQQKQQMKSRQTAQSGGQQQSNDPGTDDGNGQWGNKPPRPPGPLVDDARAWGHLPPSLREASENIFKEDYLPSKSELIKRYYLSVSKKALTRGE